MSLESLPPLPPRLQELDEQTRMLSSVAQAYEDMTNDFECDRFEKIQAASELVNTLDRYAKDIYYNRQVDISGEYYIPHIATSRDTTTIEPVFEMGMRRGASNGFYATENTIELAETGAQITNIQFHHQVYLDRAQINSGIAWFNGFELLRAPISGSEICISEITDYYESQAIFAAINNIRDADLREDLDEILFSDQTLALDDLHEYISTLKTIAPGRLDDFLSYINVTLSLVNTPVELLTQLAIDYTPEGASQLHHELSIVSGISDGICLGTSYSVDAEAGAASVKSHEEPLLAIRAQVEGDTRQRTVHIPLADIVEHVISA